MLRPDTVMSTKKGVIRVYVLATLCQCLSYLILTFSRTTITTGQSHVPPGTENISHFVFVFTSVKYFPFN